MFIISIQSLGVNSPHSLQRLQEMEPSFLKLKREMKIFSGTREISKTCSLERGEKLENDLQVQGLRIVPI